MATIAKHFIEQNLLRITSDITFNVGYERSTANYVSVGQYIIPKNITEVIQNNINEIVKINFPKNQSFGIKLTQIPINPKDIINYQKPEGSTNAYVIIDSVSNSNGNVIYAIVRHNTLITIYFGKSYIQQTPQKLNVDYIIADIKKFKPRN